MKINQVKKARKDQGACGKCGVEIRKGDAYKWIKFRYGGRRLRCMNRGCMFRPSDLTSSDKLSRVYGAQEALEDALKGWDRKTLDHLSGAVEGCADDLREVASEYEESADSIRDSFPDSSTADECEEKAQGLEVWADEIEGAFEEIDSFTWDDVEDGQYYSEAREEWADVVVEEMEDIISDCPV